MKISNFVTVSTLGSVYTVARNCKYFDLLKEFLSITNFANNFNNEVKHSTCHSIITKGTPVSSKAGRLPANKLIIAKK